MLVLQRRLGEKIVVNGNIVITICRLIPGSVFVGIDAPRDVVVNREEVQEAIEREREVKP